MKTKLILKIIFTVAMVFILALCVVSIANMKEFNINNIVTNLIKATPDKKLTSLASDVITQLDTTPEIRQDRGLEEVDHLIGRYQFNITGAGIGVRYNDLNSGLSTTEEAKEYEYDQSSEFKRNSSGAYLDGSDNEGGSIYKAYLLVESTLDRQGDIKMGEYPITFLYGGEDGTITSGIQSKLQVVNSSSKDSNVRENGYIDVTDFVKEHKYGWYYCCNIPYEHSNSWDSYACWKLIIIEQNPNNPIRCLELTIGNSIVAASESITSEVTAEPILTKANGTVTGQILFSMGGSDLYDYGGRINNGMYYSSDSVTFKNIITENRTEDNPLIGRILKNGKEIKQKKNYPTPIYTNGYNTSRTKVDDSYWIVDGVDLDVIDITGSDSHNVTFENSKQKIAFKFSSLGPGIVLSTSALGMVFDVDVPIFDAVQTTTVNSRESVTVSGKTSNTTKVNNVGMCNGEFIINIDEALDIKDYTAYVYINGVREKIEGKIQGNQIIFDLDLKNNTDYIEYTINCEPNGKGTLKYNNSDIYLGNLYNNAEETSVYLSDVSHSNSSGIPIYTLTVKPNQGEWKGESSDKVIEMQAGATEHIELPTRAGYTFDGWDLTGTGSSMGNLKEESDFTMGSENAQLQAKWKANTNTKYTINYWLQKLGMGTEENENNYEKHESVTAEGETDTTVTAEVKTYDGFISPSAKQVTITADGLAKVDYYYTRRTDLEYTVRYIDWDTKLDIQSSETRTDQVFGDTIDSEEEKIVLEKYDFHSIEPKELEITANNEDNVIKIYYTKKAGSVVVHHYIDGTITQVPSNEVGINVADQTQNGKVDDQYTTNVASNIAPNYEYSHVDISGAPGAEEHDGTVTGLMQIGEIQIIYYYSLKNSETTSSLTKEGTSNITEKDQELEYTITYDAEINDYTGNATITIVDTLPYEIDEDASELGTGAVYSKENKTITWTEHENNIDIVSEGKAHAIHIEKTIKIVYSNLDTNDISFVNKVAGQIYLETTKQTIQATGAQMETQTDFYKDITVTKKWEHGKNIYGNPERVTLQIKNGEAVVQSQEVTIADKVGDDNTWEHTFTDLPKYTADGEVINYSIDEAEDASLAYYKKTIDEASQTITNTYIGPEISSSKSATIILGTEEPRDYGAEGDTIRYVITVENAGQTEKEVTIKDGIPTGTTFKTGSLEVKKGEELLTGFKIANLTGSGIKVVVPPKTGAENGKVTVKFDVTVNDLEDDIFEEVIENTAIVDGEPTETTKTNVKKPNVSIRKTAKPEAGTKVTAGQKIVYSISVRNTGAAPEEAIIKDTVPAGTTFVAKSIKVDNVEKVDLTEKELAEGITVEVEPETTEIIEFAVTVNDLDDGEEIINVAKVDEHPLHHGNIERETKEVIHKYVEPQITVNKSLTTQNSKAYVIPGEKITYTIEAENSGGLEKQILVKDTIPSGTTYSAGTLKVTGQAVEKTYDITQLTTEGITITVPEATTNEENEEKTNGKVTITFDVTVDAETTGEISNIAKINKTPEVPGSVEEETNPTKVSILTYSKEMEVVERGDTEIELGQNEVAVGDTVKYTIKVNNTGNQKIQNLAIEDIVPEGLEVINTNGGTKEDRTIRWQIDVEANSTNSVSFTAKVKHSVVEYTIENTATVDGNKTNTVKNSYKEPGIQLNSEITKTADIDKVISEETPVYYTIEYKATVQYFEGKAKVKIVDTLPYPIDEDASQLEGGVYEENLAEKKYTITWEIPEYEINTFETGEPKEIKITKGIQLKYKYEDIDNTNGTMVNKVTSNTDLQILKAGASEYETIKEEEKSTQAEMSIEIPAEVILHHYIYDKEKGGNTDTKLIEDTKMDGVIGEEYTAVPAETIPKNYVCRDTKPENYTGKYTEKPIEVNFYYELQEPEMTSTISKTSEKKTLTKQEEPAKYTIDYTVNVSKYIGKIKVKIVDKLPAKIDVAKSKIGENAVYSEENQTITWTEEVEGIDTYDGSGEYAGGSYREGTYTKHFIKEIEVVYKEQDITADLENTVTGAFEVYYPQKHTTTPGEPQKEVTENTKETISQDYKVNVKVEKQWDDNGNKRGHRPDAVKIKIAGEGTEIEQTLNEANNWTYEAKDLKVYNAKGEKIEYVVTESEAKAGDFKYYDEAEITKTESEDKGTYIYNVKNTYKVLKADCNSDITKTASYVIKERDEKVDYTIKYHIEIPEYLGDGVITIVDTLPYKIDEKNSKLDGGKYNDERQTITWEKEIENIDTIENGPFTYNITKNISLLYTGIDASKVNMLNTVKGRMQLYETNQSDEVTAMANTRIDIQGRVIVKYLDVDTNEEVAPQKIITGKVGDPYTTSKAADSELQPNYEYVEELEPENKTGVIKEEDTYVTYYYRVPKGKVIVRHLDIDTNEKIVENIVITEKIGTVYTTKELSSEELNDRYEYLPEVGPANKQVTVTKEDTYVTYYYKRVTGEVIVKHIDKDTNTKLCEDEKITGYVGESYSTARKAISKYMAAEPEPTNKIGEITKAPIEVIYYYEKITSGVITVKYIDEDTGIEITYTETKEDGSKEEKTYRYEIRGKVGDKYKTENKQIPYYRFVKTLGATEGILTENGETVIYYHKKLDFNFAVEQEIKQVILNGEAKKITNKEAMKLEIVADEIGKTKLQVTYLITVRNTGEIDGKAQIVENIPEGFKLAGAESYWRQREDGNLETTVELKAGEERQLEVVLEWVNGDSNFGVFENIAKIEKTENEPNFEETNLADNKSEVEIITSIKTGIEENVMVVVLLTILIVLLFILKNAKKEYNKQK